MTIAPFAECRKRMGNETCGAAAHLYPARAGEGYPSRVRAAREVFGDGIVAAVELGREVSPTRDIRGINQSGFTGPGRETWFAEALARISEELDVL